MTRLWRFLIEFTAWRLGFYLSRDMALSASILVKMQGADVGANAQKGRQSDLQKPTSTYKNN